ncbi:MAG: hypothetical protein JNJ63_00625 [Hyphomonadaceae bacterium]|nr:hypothetical protein [Hyphomonadaceae bacterium]
MLLRKLVVVGLVGFVTLTANIATAEDAGAPGFAAVDGVDLVDPSDAFSDDRFDLQFSQTEAPRFADVGARSEPSRREQDMRRYEFSLVARGAAGLDVAFAQRGGVGFNEQGDIERQSRGSELRLGRGLRDDERSSTPTWYIFAASDDEAITWRPGVRNAFGGSGASFSLRDRVEIGDIQAGITYERDGWQASIAYVEREISASTGVYTVYQDENFAGFTLTMRH